MGGRGQRGWDIPHIPPKRCCPGNPCPSLVLSHRRSLRSCQGLPAAPRQGVLLFLLPCCDSRHVSAHDSGSGSHLKQICLKVNLSLAFLIVIIIVICTYPLEIKWGTLRQTAPESVGRGGSPHPSLKHLPPNIVRFHHPDSLRQLTASPECGKCRNKY